MAGSLKLLISRSSAASHRAGHGLTPALVFNTPGTANSTAPVSAPAVTTRSSSIYGWPCDRAWLSWRCSMKAILLGCAFSLLAVPASSADLSMLPLKAPTAAAFSWTSCYAGGQVGGGWESSDVTDPVQLVQDSFLFAGATTGVTTVGVNSAGFVGGGQIGCDYQFDPRWVLGIEGAILGSTMKGSNTVGLPLGNPGDMATVSAKTDFIPSVTVRAGYALDRVLLYAKGGVAWAGDTYDVTGSFTGIPFGFEGLDTRTGFTVGGGVEWAFSGPWSLSLEYDYYNFGHGTVLMIDPVNAPLGLPVDTKQNIQVVLLGLNFHVFAGQSIAP